MSKSVLRTWWAIATVGGVFLMLTLGALVTSFKAGMSDNVWPRSPWALFTIEWEQWGLFVEHAHRFTGYILGLMMTGLALSLWSGEPDGTRRRGGYTAMALVMAGVALLIWVHRVKTPIGPGAGLVEPTFAEDHPLIGALPFVLIGGGLLVLTAIGVGVVASRQPGRGARIAAVAMLLAVMAQGLLGGFRVKLDAMYGGDLAAIHGAFSQVVLGLTVITVLAAATPTQSPDARRMHAESTARLDRWALVAAGCVYLQIMAGVALRHSTSTLGSFGPRLHLWLVFPAVVAVLGVAWRILHTAAPRSVRLLAYSLVAIVVVQIGLGIESWLARFDVGLTASLWKPITVSDAVLRSAHAVVGYGLFATTVALAWQTRRPADVTRFISVNVSALEAVG